MTNDILSRKYLCEDYKAVFEGMTSSLGELSKVMSKGLGIDVGTFEVIVPFEERHPEHIYMESVIAGLPKTKTIIHLLGNIKRGPDGKAQYNAVLEYHIINAIGIESHVTLGSVIFKNGEWEINLI